MTDPAKLADAIESYSSMRQTGDLTTMQMRPESWRMIAAALRLAEAVPAHFSDDVQSYCVVCDGTPGKWQFESDETPIQHKPDCPLVAYRRAKEEAK